jgi:hypothetical protein
MKKQGTTSKKSLISLILVVLLAGCSSTTTTKTTTTRKEPIDYNRQPIEVVETQEVTETESSSCGGILGCTVEGVGLILALPFKAVGLLIDVIF